MREGDWQGLRQDYGQGPIFISYRRADLGSSIEEILRALSAAQIGRGLAQLEFSELGPDDSREDAIRSTVASCGLLLALIGPRWATDSEGQWRLGNFVADVRIELEAAWQHDIPVAVVLIGTSMPTYAELPIETRYLVDCPRLYLEDLGRIDTRELVLHLRQFIAKTIEPLSQIASGGSSEPFANPSDKQTDDQAWQSADVSEKAHDTFDTNADGLADRFEALASSTSPHSADTDADGLMDAFEALASSTSPHSADSDVDHVADGEERKDATGNGPSVGPVVDGAVNYREFFCARCGVKIAPFQRLCDTCGGYLAASDLSVVPTEPLRAPAARATPPPSAYTNHSGEHRLDSFSRTRSLTSTPQVRRWRLIEKFFNRTVEDADLGQLSRSLPLESVLERVVKDLVGTGRIGFNPPDQMRQGRVERLEITISRFAGLDDELGKNLQGRGELQIEDLRVSPFMVVELRGSGFEITPLNPTPGGQQLLLPTARWEFDLLPKRSGAQVLQVCAAMRIPIPDQPDERVSIPVLERHIRVLVDPYYGSRQFVRRNWQWLVGAGVGLGGAIGAWFELFR